MAEWQEILSRIYNLDYDTEFDWYAVDQCGHVGVFSTAGFGDIPSVVFDNIKDYPLVTQYFENSINSSGKRPFDNNYLCIDWEMATTLGLFVYDWEHFNGPYFKRVSPLSPLNINELPEVALSVITRVRLDILFNDIDKINLAETIL